MRVRKLINGDWTFGSGKANYITGDEAITQNVITRLKSLKNDFFLDVDSNIDWFGILSEINNKQTILNEIYRVVSATDGVVEINSIDILAVDKRDATMVVNFATINTSRIQIQTGVTNG